jgi:internalin A
MNKIQIKKCYPYGELIKVSYHRYTSISLNYLGLKVIPPFHNLLSLKSLDLSSNKIIDISLLKKSNTMKSLDLSYNDIYDLSPLINLTNLEYLELHYNFIKDISPLGNLSNLKELNLKGNRIDNIEPLKTLNHLEYLFLSNNPIPQEQIKELQKTLPDCEIVY